ncbi:hypothetical protein ABT369_57670 [Dactylosporangium sp. NPDC000244]|uniref:hypothetical protein n=1 Tax=Dactylosporangium sp. NPDC000244 TaxID=3154365 RepID=UPI00331D76A7
MPRQHHAASAHAADHARYKDGADGCFVAKTILSPVRWWNDHRMGYFAAFLFDGTAWAPADSDEIEVPESEHWMHLDIHDSDLTFVSYRPVGAGTGVCYLGFTPRTYFDEPTASAPTDVQRECAALADWWAGWRGGATDAERTAMAERLRPYLAEDEEQPEIDPDEEDDEDDEDADVFVEVKTDRFIAALELPPFRNLDPA